MVYSVQVIDLRSDVDCATAEREPAWRVRNRLRHQLALVMSGDLLRLQVDRTSLPSDVVDLIPTGVRVQVESDDVITLRLWLDALGGFA